MTWLPCHFFLVLLTAKTKKSQIELHLCSPYDARLWHEPNMIATLKLNHHSHVLCSASQPKPMAESELKPLLLFEFECWLIVHYFVLDLVLVVYEYEARWEKVSYAVVDMFCVFCLVFILFSFRSFYFTHSIENDAFVSQCTIFRNANGTSVIVCIDK